MWQAEEEEEEEGWLTSCSHFYVCVSDIKRHAGRCLYLLTGVTALNAPVQGRWQLKKVSNIDGGVETKLNVSIVPEAESKKHT